MAFFLFLLVKMMDGSVCLTHHLLRLLVGCCVLGSAGKWRLFAGCGCLYSGRLFFAAFCENSCRMGFG